MTNIRSYTIASERDAGATYSHEHRYKGGPPPKRIYRMQLAHEVRARKAGVPWDMVDLREVYRHHDGLCGICREPVSLEEFTIDHVIPLSKGGAHLFENMQLAHKGCNSSKGNKVGYTRESTR